MISVIIVNYHSAGILQRAAASVLDEADHDVEILVVDNTATDEERRLLQGLSASMPLTLLFNQDNVGFAKACNQAYGRSRGEFIFLLNPDAYLLPGCLRVLCDFLQATKNAGAVSPQVFWDEGMRFFFPLYPGQSPLQDLMVKLCDASPLFERFFSAYARLQNIRLWTARSPVQAGNLSGGAVMLRRKAVDLSGGLFDERFFLFFEDTDLFLRLRKRGFRLAIHPDAKAVHHYEQRQSKMEIMERTRPLFYAKHYRNSVLRRIAGGIPPRKRPFGHTNLGDWDRPPEFQVPECLRRRFLFEWSPSPHFIPAVGCFARGDAFAFPAEIWEGLDPGSYFSRISRPRALGARPAVSCWRKGG